MKRILLMLNLALAVAICVGPAFAAVPDAFAFQQLQSLVGNWEGTGDLGPEGSRSAAARLLVFSAYPLHARSLASSG